MADMEARGLPAVYVATVEFTDGAAAQAKSLGTDVASIFVEHPIQDRTDEEMLKIADQAFDGVLGALT